MAHKSELLGSAQILLLDSHFRVCFASCSETFGGCCCLSMGSLGGFLLSEDSSRVFPTV